MRQVTAASTILVVMFASQSLAACVTPSATQSEIEAFKTNPESILTMGRASAPEAMRMARKLAGTKAEMVGLIISVLNGASSRLKAALGAGVGQADMSCRHLDKLHAAAIELEVAKSTDPDFNAAFASVTGQRSTGPQNQSHGLGGNVGGGTPTSTASGSSPSRSIGGHSSSTGSPAGSFSGSWNAASTPSNGSNHSVSPWR